MAGSAGLQPQYCECVWQALHRYSPGHYRLSPTPGSCYAARAHGTVLTPALQECCPLHCRSAGLCMAMLRAGGVAWRGAPGYSAGVLAPALQSCRPLHGDAARVGGSAWGGGARRGAGCCPLRCRAARKEGQCGSADACAAVLRSGGECIGRRTRAQHSLKEVEIGELEALLRGDQEDEYQRFLLVRAGTVGTVHRTPHMLAWGVLHTLYLRPAGMGWYRTLCTMHCTPPACLPASTAWDGTRHRSAPPLRGPRSTRRYCWVHHTLHSLPDDTSWYCTHCSLCSACWYGRAGAACIPYSV
jgi:hypothetical protein